jgi:hypothetical protein
MLLRASDFTSLPFLNEGASEEAAKQGKSIAAALSLLKIGALAESASFLIGPYVAYETADQAEDARDEWVAHADSVLFSGEVPGESFAAVMNLRTQVHKYLTNLSYTLPRIYTYVPTRTVPSLVLAYELYGDATKRADIIRRNAIRNPMLIQGGIPIEVIAYD